MPPVTTPGSLADLVGADIDDALGDLPVATDTYSIDVNDTDVPGQVRFRRRGFNLTNSAARTNTNAEVSLLAVPVTGSWDFPANTLSLGDLIRVRFIGTVTNNTGSDRTIIFKVTLDTLTSMSFTTPNIASSASSRVYVFDLEFSIIDFIGTRMGVTGFATMGAAGGGTSANLYTMLGVGNPLTATADLTQVLSFDFRAQMSTNSTSFTITPGLGTAELTRMETAA